MPEGGRDLAKSYENPAQNMRQIRGTVGGRKNETRRIYTKTYGRTNRRKSVFWRTSENSKKSDPRGKKRAKNNPKNAVSRPWECFLRIPRVFLILLAGFSADFAQSGPISGHFSLSGCDRAIFMSENFHFFRPPTLSRTLCSA